MSSLLTSVAQFMHRAQAYRFQQAYLFESNRNLQKRIFDWNCGLPITILSS